MEARRWKLSEISCLKSENQKALCYDKESVLARERIFCFHKDLLIPKSLMVEGRVFNIIKKVNNYLQLKPCSAAEIINIFNDKTGNKRIINFCSFLAINCILFCIISSEIFPFVFFSSVFKYTYTVASAIFSFSYF